MECKEQLIIWKFILQKTYTQRVDKSDKRWLDDDIEDVFAGIVEYLNELKI